MLDKCFQDRAYKIAKNPKFDQYQRELLGIVHNFFVKKTGSGASVKEELVQELHKPAIKNINRKKVLATFQNNVSTADLAKMESLSSNIKVLTLPGLGFFEKLMAAREGAG